MRLSTISFLLLIAAAVILRTRPSRKASGLESRISALVGTFLIYSIALFPRRDLSLPAETISTVLTLIGTVGAAVVLVQLGRSFSVMAETRQLVTWGLIASCATRSISPRTSRSGVFMQFASLRTALVFAVQIAFQLKRVHNEETILGTTFLEYADYRRNTARLAPGICRPS